ncbi:MAG: aspartyl protease [Chloroflexi bacterium]|nr:aspartyl protease [Chloroflexota bacterium]
MAIEVFGRSARYERQVGQVYARVTIVNHTDETLAEEGFRDASQVRSVTLDAVLIDTGATTLALPANLVRALGLRRRRMVVASTAAGIREVEVCDNVRVVVEGRTGVFECLSLPEDAVPLLGAIPMEWLGLEPDLQNRRLRLLPETGRETHFLLY